VLNGCRGPNAANLAVGEPGDYTLAVRFADGTVKKNKLTVGGKKHVSLTVSDGRQDRKMSVIPDSAFD